MKNNDRYLSLKLFFDKFKIMTNNGPNLVLKKMLEKFVIPYKLDKRESCKNLEKEPVIYVGNHTNVHDVPVLACFLNQRFFLVAGKENLDLKAKILFKFLDVVYVSRSKDADNSAADKKIKEKLDKGISAVILPEGTWNNKENLLMLPLKWGFAKYHEYSNFPVVPFILEYKETKKECAIEKGVKINYTQNSSLGDKADTTRDIMSTMRYDILKEDGNFSRDEVSKEEFNKTVEKAKSEYPLDWEFEKSVILKKGINEEEVFDYLNHIQINSNNISIYANHVRRLKK